MENLGDMVTETVEIDLTIKCAFEWDSAQHKEVEPNGGHICLRDPDHDGFHGCGICGVIYIRRRDDTISFP